MKQKILIGLILLFGLFTYNEIFSCTNFIVSKGASADGACYITDNADAGGYMEPLYFILAADHKPGDSLEIYDWENGRYHGKIKQAEHTYKVIGFMNENQVTLGETTFGGRSELHDTLGIMDYGSLIQVTLQRAKTARDAIKIMTDLVAEYGYCSSGESFSVADPNEAWILELISKGPEKRGAEWVACKIPDGYVCAHANQSRIHEFPLNDKENCLYAPDVIKFAIEKGYYKPESGKFGFADAYAPLDPGAALYCEDRVWSLYRRAAPSLNLSDDYWRAVKGATPYPLFIKPDKKLTIKEIMGLMRDHFEGTQYDMTKGLVAEPYGNPCRWKPLEWKIDGDTVNTYAWERPISTQQTAFSYVAQMRSDYPNEVGGVLWYGVDDTYSSCYVPLYMSLKTPPQIYEVGSITELNLNSAFWIFNLVANIAYTKYSYVIKDIQKVQTELEDKFIASQPAVDKAAIELNSTNKSYMIDFLSDYSASQANMTFDRWANLWKQLVVKYNDGYVNDVKIDKGRHPKGVGYSNDFNKRVLQERPGYYDVKWRTGNQK